MNSRHFILSIFSIFSLFSCNPGKGGDEKEKTGILTYQETISYIEKHSMATPSKPSSGHIVFTHNNHIVAKAMLNALGAINTESITEGNNDISQSKIDEWYGKLETELISKDLEQVVLALTKTNFTKYFDDEHKDNYIYKVENNILTISYDKEEGTDKNKYIRTYNSSLLLTKFEVDVNASETIKYTATQTFTY